VERHADRLQRRGAEAVDGRARDGHRVAGEQQRVAGDVVALLPFSGGRAHHHVDDRGGVELRVALQERSEGDRGEVVSTNVLQRALDGTADRRPDGVDDDGIRHEVIPFDEVPGGRTPRACVFPGGRTPRGPAVKDRTNGGVQTLIAMDVL
jgi:hypothetical protein